MMKPIDLELQELQQRAIGAGHEAVADAIETHRRMGRSIVMAENGVVKHIKAKDLKPRALPGDEADDE